MQHCNVVGWVVVGLLYFWYLSSLSSIVEQLYTTNGSFKWEHYWTMSNDMGYFTSNFIPLQIKESNNIHLPNYLSIWRKHFYNSIKNRYLIHTISIRYTILSSLKFEPILLGLCLIYFIVCMQKYKKPEWKAKWKFWLGPGPYKNSKCVCMNESESMKGRTLWLEAKTREESNTYKRKWPYKMSSRVHHHILELQRCKACSVVCKTHILVFSLHNSLLQCFNMLGIPRWYCYIRYN